MGTERAISSEAAKTPGLGRTIARAWIRLHIPFVRRRVGKLRIETVGDLSVVVLPEVFNPAVFRSSDLLVEAVAALTPPSPPRVLDLGCGTGVQGLAAARRGWSVMACDINPDAVRCARINALLNRVEERVECRCGDLFAPLAGERFDLVLFNPPFFRGAPKDPLEHAWRSEDVPERFAAQLAEHLNPGGLLLLVHSSDGLPEVYLESLRRQGFTVAVERRRDLGNEVMTVYRAELAR